MAVNSLHVVDIIEVMENFLEKVRPPEDIRSKLDITYKIEKQSVVIYEVRQRWDDPKITMEHAVAKATYVKSSNSWKIFWLRSNLKWFTYLPLSSVKTLKEFAEEVDKDPNGCFWG